LRCLSPGALSVNSCSAIRIETLGAIPFSERFEQNLFVFSRLVVEARKLRVGIQHKHVSRRAEETSR
jgi:hypothetical protein